MNQSAQIFKKNVVSLQKINSKLAFQLWAIDPVDLSFCRTEAKELNLMRHFEGKSYLYHSPSSAKPEAEEWFQSLNLNQAEILYVYGIGLGYYYQAAKKWLKAKPKRRFIVLEQDRAVLARFLETELATEFLKDSQTQLVCFEDVLEDQALFNELSWTYLNSPFVVSYLKLYQEVNPAGCLQLHHRLSYELVQKKAFVEEYLQYGIAFFRNFYPNLLELPKSYLGNGLFRQFEGVPAIICGAGPSLNKNLDVLRTLKDQALLFAGSSALNALIPKGILPHFGAAIDPNQAQVSRVSVAQAHRLPFFYRSRLFHEALKAITGPRLYLTGTGGYTLSEWFEQELGLEGENLDEGHNVINFCLAIARSLGCNPLILVGVDLAFTGQQPYADGVAANLGLTEKDFKTADDFESQPFLKEDINGQAVYTLWKWVTEAEWIADFAKEHPELTVINATEGGLGFKGISNQTLQEVVKTHLSPVEQLDQKVQQTIAEQALSIKEERIKELMRTLQASLDHCIDLLTQLLKENGQLREEIEQDQPFPESLQTPALSLLESEIENELSYQYVLDTFNQVYMRVHHREAQDLQRPRRGFTAKKRALGKLNLQLGRLTFLRDVARVNRELIERTLK